MPIETSERAAAFLPLHALDFRVLLSLLGGAAHGYRIVRAIEQSEPSWARIFPANLYRRIRALIRSELLVETSAPVSEPSRMSAPSTSSSSVARGRSSLGLQP